MNPKLRSQLQELIGSASNTTVPSGVLSWWAPARIPNGRKVAPCITSPEWQLEYARLTARALLPGWLPDVTSLVASQRDVSPAGPIALAITCLPYRRTRGKVLRAVSKAIKKDRPLADPPKSLDAATKADTAFMIAPLLSAQWARTEPAIASPVFQLVIDPSFCVTGPDGVKPEAMALSVDGAEPRPVRFGDRVTVVANKARVTLTLTAQVAGQSRTASCSVPIDTSVPSAMPDEVWPIAVPGGMTGRVSVFRGTDTGKQRRMVILSEGFPGGHSPWNSYGVLNQNGFADKLRKSGRDLLILGMDNGLARIEANAELVIAAIQKASQCGRDHVVGGVSMGGMTTRYALTAMEHRGLDHHTQAYISIDSPHRGSATCPSVQWFAQTFAQELPLMSEFVAELNSPANQQFLPRWFNDGKLSQSPLRTELENELKQMGGYPKRCKLFAVASGRGDGATSFRPGTRLLTWKAKGFAGASLQALNGGNETATTAEGAWAMSSAALPALTTDTQYAWDGAPGSQSSYLGIAAASISATGLGKVKLTTPLSCVVPTASALDMQLPPMTPIPSPQTGKSPYDDYRVAASNLPHMGFDAATSDWMLDCVLNNTPPQN